MESYLPKCSVANWFLDTGGKSHTRPNPRAHTPQPSWRSGESSVGSLKRLLAAINRPGKRASRKERGSRMEVSAFAFSVEGQSKQTRHLRLTSHLRLIIRPPRDIIRLHVRVPHV